MKIALVGKGGSGKTTLSALLARYLAEAGAPVLAIDADINQHLAEALGLPADEAARLPTLADHLAELKEYLRGDNPRIASAAAMIKTTPPGRGSRLLTVTGDNPVYRSVVRAVGPVRLALAGQLAASDLGVACYHSKVGAVELLLNHLVDGPGEYAVVDMTAGADAFASGLFTRFDQTFVVCEPTLRSVGVYRQYAGHAAGHGVRLAAVGNKVSDAQDAAFLREQLGAALVGTVGRSDYVRAAERGRVGPLAALEPANLALLGELVARVGSAERDPVEYARRAAEFHLRNAHAWGNDRVGADLAGQIDPDFALPYPEPAHR
ncbi:hypothetical protein Athai_37550 [Actinocatenispora thailandica]|uniref:CobQ/CobB/MinD/ParA nucleotide binding domain-containing protein n=1 Tax=Actinocatenispora thailandica TaxID=227318 RepID=A0A7R7DR60_9ACTN|nr:AAA family ATPase [Actinocatenispora thailandica]BCJ36252.1 hypothetical protein Athai_37550 [Actinocatenispora thailandica]